MRNVTKINHLLQKYTDLHTGYLNCYRMDGYAIEGLHFGVNHGLFWACTVGKHLHMIRYRFSTVRADVVISVK